MKLRKSRKSMKFKTLSTTKTMTVYSLVALTFCQGAFAAAPPTYIALTPDETGNVQYDYSKEISAVTTTTTDMVYDVAKLSTMIFVASFYQFYVRPKMRESLRGLNDNKQLTEAELQKINSQYSDVKIIQKNAGDIEALKKAQIASLESKEVKAAQVYLQEKSERYGNSRILPDGADDITKQRYQEASESHYENYREAEVRLLTTMPIITHQPEFSAALQEEEAKVLANAPNRAPLSSKEEIDRRTTYLTNRENMTPEQRAAERKAELELPGVKRVLEFKNLTEYTNILKNIFSLKRNRNIFAGLSAAVIVGLPLHTLLFSKSSYLAKTFKKYMNKNLKIVKARADLACQSHGAVHSVDPQKIKLASKVLSAERLRYTEEKFILGQELLNPPDEDFSDFEKGTYYMIDPNTVTCKVVDQETSRLERLADLMTEPLPQ